MPEIGKRLDNDRRQGRITGEPRIRRPDVAVVANGVDTYVRPGQSKLGQLAEALSSIQPSVGRLSEVVMDRTVESETQEGLAAARQMAVDGRAYKEAVENGEIPASASPWFMAALEEESGQAHGHQYGSDLAEAMANSPGLQASLSLEDFDEFEREFRNGWLEQRVGGSANGRFMSAFNNLVEAEVNTRRRPEFVAGLEKRIREKASRTFTANATQFLVKDGALPDEDLLSNLKLLRERQFSIGRSLNDVDFDTATALGEAALATGEYKYLLLAGKLQGGTGTELAFDPKLSEVIRGYESKLTTKLAQEQKQAELAEKKRKKDVLNSARTAILKELKDNPLMPNFDGVVGEAGEYAEDVLGLAKKLQGLHDSTHTGDELEYAKMNRRIRYPEGSPLSREEIWRKVDSKLISYAQGQKLDEAMENRNIKLANLAEKQKSRGLQERQGGELLKQNFVKLKERQINAMFPASLDHNGAVWRATAVNDMLIRIDEAILNGEVDPYNSAQMATWSREHLDPEMENLRFNIEGAYGFSPLMGQDKVHGTGEKAPSSPSGETSSAPPRQPAGKTAEAPKSDSGASQGLSRISAGATPAEMKAKHSELKLAYPNDPERVKLEYINWVKGKAK